MWRTVANRNLTKLVEDPITSARSCGDLNAVAFIFCINTLARLCPSLSITVMASYEKQASKQSCTTSRPAEVLAKRTVLQKPDFV